MSNVATEQARPGLRDRLPKFPGLTKLQRRIGLSAVSAGMLAADHYSSVLKDTPHDLRGELPNVIDLFNHSGNFFGSWATGIAINAVGRFANKLPVISVAEIERRNKIAAGVACAAVVAVNVIAETKLYTQIGLFDPKTPPVADIVDFAYGLAAGAVGAAVATEFISERPL